MEAAAAVGLGYEAKISIAQASGTEGSFCSFCCAGRLGVWAEGQPHTSSPGAVDHSPACPLGMLLQPGPCKLPTHRSGAHLHSVGPVFLAPHTPFLDGSSDAHRRGVLRPSVWVLEHRQPGPRPQAGRTVASAGLHPKHPANTGAGEASAQGGGL